MRIGERASSLLRVGPALLTALAVVALVAPAGAAAAEEPAFCRSTTLRDYLAPLKQMPKAREVPYRRASIFKFRGVYLGSSGPAVAVGGGSAGYLFQWDKNPGWDVTVTLEQMRSDGTVMRRIGERRRDFDAVAPVESAEPQFILPGKPASYRTTLVIRTRSGRKLARFANYYQVVRPTVDASLVPEATTYRPGETVFARLENPGASFALFGMEHDLEALQGETWVPAPEVPSPLASPLYNVAPGASSGHCIAFPIPTSFPPGHYRLAQEAVISWPSREEQIRPVLHAEFEVTGG